MNLKSNDLFRAQYFIGINAGRAHIKPAGILRSQYVRPNPYSNKGT